jgi:hypothetical protein
MVPRHNGENIPFSLRTFSGPCVNRLTFQPTCLCTCMPACVPPSTHTYIMFHKQGDQMNLWKIAQTVIRNFFRGQKKPTFWTIFVIYNNYPKKKTCHLDKNSPNLVTLSRRNLDSKTLKHTCDYTWVFSVNAAVLNFRCFVLLWIGL